MQINEHEDKITQSCLRTYSRMIGFREVIPGGTRKTLLHLN